MDAGGEDAICVSVRYQDSRRESEDCSCSEHQSAKDSVNKDPRKAKKHQTQATSFAAATFVWLEHSLQPPNGTIIACCSTGDLCDLLGVWARAIMTPWHE